MGNEDGAATDWLDKVERAFNFACHAKEAFTKGNIETKKKIAMALGSNWTLMDKKLRVSPSKWLVPIEKGYPALEREYFRFEPIKNKVSTAKNAMLESIKQNWLPISYKVRAEIYNAGAHFIVPRLSELPS